MELKHQPRCGLALGGMGSGWFELRHDGRFRNWSIFNNEPYGTGPSLGQQSENVLFFVVRYQPKGEPPRMKILQIPNRHDVGTLPAQLFAFPWMSGVAKIESDMSFPFTKLKFTDPEMPLVIEMEAFSPFIPHDVKNTSLPTAIFNFSVRSTSPQPVHVVLVGTFMNLIGHDVPHKRFTGCFERGEDWTMIETGAERMDTAHDTWGTQALFSLAEDSSYYLGWDHRHPYYEKLIEKTELPNVNDVDNRNYGKDPETGEKLAAGNLKSSLAVSRRLKPEHTFQHTFLKTWHIPNRYARGNVKKGEAKAVPSPRRLEGYYYANFFQSAADVGHYVRTNLTSLTERTRRFHADFFDSSLPPFVLDQINSHLNTFLTSAWLTKAGDFGIQEGMTDNQTWGPLATIDVSLYGAEPIVALFPELDQSMMLAHARLQSANGEVGHGIDRNFGAVDAHEAVQSRLDLPSQFVLLALRGYFWTGNKEYLTRIWPNVKSALDYVLRERDANGDLLPDMGGAMCSYDNFPMFGTASFVASLWLAALAHAVEAGRKLGDEESSRRYADILAKARQTFEDKLWKGRYYILYNDLGGKKGDADLGCLTDQIIGQWTMHSVGLGYLFDRRRVQSVLREVLKRNRRYWGLRNCTWPGETFIKPVPAENWGDQSNTCWSGTELAFASFLWYEGMVEEALAVIQDVDRRYRQAGLYFDHQEWGGHYYRPMASWAILNASLGLTVCDGRYGFSPPSTDKNLRLFFAVPCATGHYTRKTTGKKETVTISLASGSMTCREVALRLPKLPGKISVQAPETFTTAFEPGRLVVRFTPPVKLEAGAKIVAKLS